MNVFEIAFITLVAVLLLANQVLTEIKLKEMTHELDELWELYQEKEDGENGINTRI